MCVTKEGREMVEKILRIARVKGIDNDVGRRFDSRLKDGDGDNAFANELNRVMKKKEKTDSSEIPEAYKLELTNIGTQSLFYYGGLNLNELLG